jgi:hypothetical protein
MEDIFILFYFESALLNHLWKFNLQSVLKINQTFVPTKYNKSMEKFIYKWLLIYCLIVVIPGFIGANETPNRVGDASHPFFVSVTEIQHNSKAKTLEISCKIFSDDFEKTLRQNYKTHVDLLNPKDKAAMDTLVSAYIKQHLQISSDGKLPNLQYMGYETDQGAVWSYFQAENIAKIKTIDINNTLLFEYKKQQTNLLHVTVNGIRKSTRLNNPESKVSFQFNSR